MQNHHCDDNFDFQKELLELLSTEETDDDNICLISNLPLENNFIKLACGHKFNYDSIFNEIKYQKNPNHLETQKLYTHELKCPYCRTVQKGLLPSRDTFKIYTVLTGPRNINIWQINVIIYIYLVREKALLVVRNVSINIALLMKRLY